jgi:hypothetical protein
MSNGATLNIIAGATCYLNSALQTLFGAESFFRDLQRIHRQQVGLKVGFTRNRILRETRCETRRENSILHPSGLIRTDARCETRREIIVYPWGKTLSHLVSLLVSSRVKWSYFGPVYTNNKILSRRAARHTYSSNLVTRHRATQCKTKTTVLVNRPLAHKYFGRSL